MAQKDSLKALERQKQALSLALAGVDYQTIANKVGYKSKQAAWKAVKSAIAKTIKPAAEEVKEMQIGRLDTMLRAIWPNVVNGNLLAIDRAIKLEERRSRLLGIDAPTKAEVNINDLTDEERIIKVLELLDAARARADGQTPKLD